MELEEQNKEEPLEQEQKLQKFEGKIDKESICLGLLSILIG